MAQAATIDRACAVAEGKTPDILESIHAPGCAAAIWRRRPAPEFQDWIAALRPEQLPQARLSLRPDRVEEAVHVLCAEKGIAADPCCAMLASDTAALATLLVQVTAAEMVHLRFDVIRDNACGQFHLDNVPARLLCTYRGRGTQYAVWRSAGDPSPIHELPTGSVGLFRGKQWHGSEMSGVVHRSPPIMGAGETRLLLVLDPVQV